MKTPFHIEPYSYEDPFISKITTMVSPDVYGPTSKDQIRGIMGNLYENEKFTWDLHDITIDLGSSTGGGTIAGGVTPRWLDLEEVTDENGYQVVNINISENPFISHAEMATTRINTIDPGVIVPNFKIPMRFFGSDPNMPGGDQFWYIYFMGGEYGGATYEPKLDNKTMFYDECMRLPLPYSETEKANATALSIINRDVIMSDLSDADPYGMLKRWVELMSSATIEPEMVYYNAKIGKYIPWAQELTTERLIPNHSLYESMLETYYSFGLPGSGFLTKYFDTTRMYNQIGQAVLSYYIQWDIQSTTDVVPADAKQTPSVLWSPDLPEHRYTGYSVYDARRYAAQNITRRFGDDDSSTWHDWAVAGSKFLRNTGSCSKYLYYYSLNSFSASVLAEVDQRNENILFTQKYWNNTYHNRGPDPDQPVYGMFPYYTKIAFPTHICRGNAYDIGDDFAQVPSSWLIGTPSTITEDRGTHIQTWNHPYTFLQNMSDHDYTARFLEILKDMNDDNWSPLSFQDRELVTQVAKLSPYGDATTAARPGGGGVTTHQPLKYDFQIETNAYRSFDFIEFLSTTYNNPTEALNKNFMFMGGDISEGSTHHAELEATYRDDGIHRYFNCSASIGTLNSSTKTLLRTYEQMMNRMVETDETMGDGDITDDYKTIKGFLEPNLRHTEVLGYRIEKLGGHTTGDQTNTNIVQNFWSINDWLPNASDAAAEFGGVPPLGFAQFFDTQLKYEKDYTYNIYAYVLGLGFKYRYGDFRLTRQLSYDDVDGTYCLEFYDPFTMERSGQLFKRGAGLDSDPGSTVLTGLWSYYAGTASPHDILGGYGADSLAEVMRMMVGFAGSVGTMEADAGSIYGLDDAAPFADPAGAGEGGAGDSHTLYWSLGYYDEDALPAYSSDQWLVALDELNRKRADWMLQSAQSLAALDPSVFDSEIWKEIGIASNQTHTGLYESIFDQFEKVGNWMRFTSRIYAGSEAYMVMGEDSGLYDLGLGVAMEDSLTYDFDALVTESSPPGVVGTIESSVLSRISAIVTSALESTSYPFLMDYHIYIEPCLKVYEIPMVNHHVTLTDNPASAANSIPFQYIDASKRIGFHCIYDSPMGESKGSPYPPALSLAELETKAKYLAAKAHKAHWSIPPYDSSRSPQRYVEVFRTTRPPESYLDFEGKLIKTIDLAIEETEFRAEDAIVSDTIKENKKYYYLIRFKNELGVPGWPSPIYEVELVNDGGYNYAKFEEYEVTSTEEKMSYTSAPFKKLFQVQPNISQMALVSENVDFTRTAGSQLQSLQVGTAAEPIWGKKFKIRLISKKTGKKIDLNVKFNLKEEDKFATLSDAYGPV